MKLSEKLFQRIVDKCNDDIDNIDKILMSYKSIRELNENEYEEYYNDVTISLGLRR